MLSVWAGEHHLEFVSVRPKISGIQSRYRMDEVGAQQRRGE
jgi:hypothetical protein